MTGHSSGIAVGIPSRPIATGSTPDGRWRLLRATHWGGDLTRPGLSGRSRTSVCFGVYRGAEPVGFGRVVTDLATYGYFTTLLSPRATGVGASGLGSPGCFLDLPSVRASGGSPVHR